MPLPYRWLTSMVARYKGKNIFDVLDMSVKDFSKYEQDFYEDDNAEMSACGTSITVLPIVLQTASLMIVQFIDLVMENPIETPFKTIRID